MILLGLSRMILFSVICLLIKVAFKAISRYIIAVMITNSLNDS